jgi:hypothetical protein
MVSNSNDAPSQTEGVESLIESFEGEIECGTDVNPVKNDANLNAEEEIDCRHELNAIGTNVKDGNESFAFRSASGSSTELMNAFGNAIGSSDEVTDLCSDANEEEIGSRNELEIDGSYADAKTKPSLVEMIAGPLLSVVGLIVISCLGNVVLGKGPQNQQGFKENAKYRKMEAVQKYKPWWMRLFG